MSIAGARDRQIVIERATVTRDALGTEVETWSPLQPEYAAVKYGTGVERREGAGRAAALTATFIVLANTGTRSVTARDRLAFDGLTWDISSAVLSTDRSEMEITATARNG